MALTVNLVIPALDEARSLPSLLGAVPASVRHVYVVDNGSSDDTARTAAGLGAFVLVEQRRGYGVACARAVQHIAGGVEPPDVVAFMHADGADDPAELDALVRPIERQRLDLVIGSYTLGQAEPGAVRLGERVSRGIAVTLIRALYGQRYTALGGFRAIRLPALVALALKEEGSGWDLEMQVKAVKAGLRVAEVPVRRRRREGAARAHSLGDAARASSKMLYTILRHATSR